jgi:hypothetical protein
VTIEWTRQQRCEALEGSARATKVSGDDGMQYAHIVALEDGTRVIELSEEAEHTPPAGVWLVAYDLDTGERVGV